MKSRASLVGALSLYRVSHPLIVDTSENIKYFIIFGVHTNIKFLYHVRS